MVGGPSRLRKRPIVDVERLIERRYEQLSPGIFESALAASFRGPKGIAYSASDRSLYVVDTGLRRVLRFDGDGHG